MKYADKLQQEITRLARLSGLDLRAVGADYHLDKGVFHLVILIRSENRIEIKYCIGNAGSAVMEFFTLDDRWAPLHHNMPRQSSIVGAELNDDETGFIVSDIERYEESVKICNLMAKEIHSRHFEDEEVKLTIFKPEKISAK